MPHTSKKLNAANNTAFPKLKSKTNVKPKQGIAGVRTRQPAALGKTTAAKKPMKKRRKRKTQKTQKTY